MKKLKEDKLPCGIYDVEYTDINKKIPAVVLGDGSINVMELINENNGFFGVGFANTQKGKIGREIFLEKDKMKFGNIDCKFHIISDNPDSLNVIINKLISVRDQLIEFNDKSRSGINEFV